MSEVKEAIELLKWQNEMGADENIEEKPIARKPTAAKKQVTKPTSTSPLKTNTNNLKGPIELEKKAREIADKCNNLKDLEEAVRNFDGVSIKKTATNTVFSDGNPDANLMLIGEAPGANEDIQGIPFCGVSGKLMDILLNWAGFHREKNVYISNTIFWRPPGNRTPTPEEIAICRPFVEKHIALVNPTALGLIGGTAALSILDLNIGVSKLRKTSHIYKNKYLDKEIPAFVFFHPSYLLRQPSQKKSFWFDLLKMREFINNNMLSG